MTLELGNPWYAQGLRFSCTQCGACCSGPPGYVWFDDAEARAMADHLQVSLDDFLRFFAHTVDGHWTLNEKRSPAGRYDCVFLRRQDGAAPRCSIYSARPTQCRTWPFWPENLSKPRAWRAVADRCPGMALGLKGQGKLFSLGHIQQQRELTP